MDHSNNKEKKNLSRHEERQQALAFVYERMFRDDSAEEVFEDAMDARDTEVGEYARVLVEGVEQHLEEIDGYIEANLRGWKKNRISRVSLTILRMAVYELLYVDSVPASVSINEAVELAKSYATAEDGSFVNGVLGAVAKSISKSGDK